ncbi:MAG: glutamate 5-kinase [Chitinispirillaceae bacterium]|jgi:glutamate 5-kinase|nr:glutamate 5-kinase [Chitinispirillaceae bacterium]
MNRTPKTVVFRKELPRLTTIVVKTGSRILASPGNETRVGNLVADLVTLHSMGIRVALVSSGAIAHGMQALCMTTRPSTIPLKQACASVGQTRLMNMYEKQFSRRGILIGQVLLTWDDLRSKKRYLNLRNTMSQLFDNRIIPIVNENDSVGIDEIRFGTNDILGAQMAMLLQADLLVNLTDVGGLFDRDPSDSDARHIPVVPRITEAMHGMVSDRKREISVGGMGSKLKAMEIVTKAGIFALIGDGFKSRLIDVLCDEKSATLFLPTRRAMSSQHRWIAFSGNPMGAIIVDKGAMNAIAEKGKSLLPAGIVDAAGTFKAGDMVDITTVDGTVFARGLVNFTADDLRRIKGCTSSAIAGILGSKEFDEAIHRDNLVLL